MAKLKSRYLLGLIFIFFGTLFILDNFDFIPYSVSRYLFTWEIPVIIIGLLVIFNSRSFFFGSILIVVGAASILSDFYDFSLYELIFDYWPIIFIVLGFSIIIKGFLATGKLKNSDSGEAKGEGAVSADSIDLLEIFSGKETAVKSDNFKGGKVTVFFAGPEINLTKTNLASGNAEIDLICFFGGVDIFVPHNWNVNKKVTAIFGGFEDERTNLQPSVPEKTLTIRGYVFFGGGSIKN